MRLHRFYVPDEVGKQEVVKIKDAKLLHQWRDVFRYTTGAQILLFDGSGTEFLGIIQRINPDMAEIRILEVIKEEKKTEKESATEVWIAAALIKNDNFDWILQKVTELGGSAILPLISERVIKKSLNMERSVRIVQEAAEQSGRLDVPQVLEPQNLVDALENFDGKVIVCQGGEGSKTFNKKMLAAKGKTLFVIGPEGGWSPKELEFFKEKKFVMTTVGKNVLRAETAVVAVTTLALV
jgi:16S rRNA (uracil1498-N3)-methyltransferase